jgi:hypothetical protein
MNKYVLTAIFALLACATQSAQAQIIFTRPTRPVGPLGPGIGGGFGGYPRGGYPYGSPFGYGYPYQTPFVPGQLPGGVGTGGLYGQPLQPNVTGQAAGSARQAGAGLADPGSPDVTGHPTRFAAYSGYFNNQGSTTSSATAVYRTPPTTTPTGGVGTQATTTPPSRSKSGASGSSRTPPR